MTAAITIPRPPAATSQAPAQAICVVLVAGAVLFNFVLAAVNRQILPLSALEVQAAEAAILAGAVGMATVHFRHAMRPWLALIWVLTLVAVARWSWLGYVDAKTLRDVIIIPVFICLGIAAGSRSLSTLVVTLQAIVLSVMLWEGFAPESFSEFLGVKDYYINTRGFEEERFWESESELFVSANRPNERYLLSFLNIHRLSSVFLEPVSLGNYCIIIAAYVFARLKAMGRWTLAFLIGSNLVLLIGCDGRLAAFCSILIVATGFLVRGPKYSSLAFLPLATLVSMFLYHGMGIEPWTDDFPGRVARTAELLSYYSPADMLGVGHALVEGIVDSGLAYIIATQSVIGLALLWGFLIFATPEDSREQALYKHGLMLYLSLTMMVSYSFLTIKTAALAWFILGALQRSDWGPKLEASGLKRRGMPQGNSGALPGHR